MAAASFQLHLRDPCRSGAEKIDQSSPRLGATMPAGGGKLGHDSRGRLANEVIRVPRAYKFLLKCAPERDSLENIHSLASAQASGFS